VEIVYKNHYFHHERRLIMDMTNAIAQLIANSINSGTPLLLAGLGLLLNEKAGVLNLGAEGLMAMGAVAGFAAASGADSASTGLLAGALIGAASAWFFSWFVVYLNTNQYATGLALSLFGVGLSAFVGQAYVGMSLVKDAVNGIPFLNQLPFVGEALFKQHYLVYFAVILAIFLSYWLDKTRSGLTLRAVGESPESAHALGTPVCRLRMVALVVGGALCGLAGAYLSVIYTPLWADGMIAGRGWIALSITIFATWRPLRAIGGAYLFGGSTMLAFFLQAIGVDVPAQIINMLPFVMVVVVLAAMSRNAEWLRVNMPASLGKPFKP
jgi:general nucleoside transport system permease protein